MHKCFAIHVPLILGIISFFDVEYFTHSDFSNNYFCDLDLFNVGLLKFYFKIVLIFRYDLYCESDKLDCQSNFFLDVG